MKKIVSLSIVILCLISSCNGQSREEQCKMHFKKAQKAFNSFYTEQNQKLLTEALTEVELSKGCPKIRLGFIELKISILSAKKDYQTGYKFIESLNKNDFTKPYKKVMQYNLFKSLDYESKSDLKNKNLYLKKAVAEIDNYIKEQKIIEQEAFYDLFFVKSKLLKKDEINQELNVLKKEYPSNSDFFEILKETFNEDIKQGNLQKAG
jgi:hypothetical protein